MKRPEKLLVVATRRIGDVLLATPLIRTLRRAWPAAQIDVLAFEDTEGILRANPDVNQVITVAEKRRFWPHLKFLFHIMRNYDLALSTLPGDRQTFYAWLAGKYRVGMVEAELKQQWKRLLLNRWVFFDNTNTHTVLMDLKLADLLEIQCHQEVVVPWRQTDEERVDCILPFDVRVESYAVLHVYPKFSYKRWQQEGWGKLGRWLKDKGIRIVLTGSNNTDELTYAAKIAEMLPQETVNLAGILSLSEVAFLVSQASLYVGLDTALTHMAAALGIPTVAIYGPTNPVKWGPWPKGHTAGNPYARRGSQSVGNVFLLQGTGDCVPCHEEGCARHIESLSDCLQRLPAAQVIDAAQRALDTASGKRNLPYK
jgi:heptosyltransferase-3